MKNQRLFLSIPIMVIVLFITVTLVWAQQSTPQGKAKILKIGVSAPTTGREAGWGLGNVWGAHQAAAEINEAGGVKVGGQTYTIKILQYDDKSTTSGGKAAGEYLIDAEEVLMVSTVVTMPTIGLQEISEPKKVFLFHGAATAYKKLMGPNKKYTFTHAFGADVMSVVMFPYMRDNYNVKTIAFLCPDTEMGTGFAADAKVHAEKAGLKIVGDETMNLQLTDFYPIISKLIKNKPDAIQYCTIPLGPDGLVAKQLYELGWKGVKSHSAGREPAKFVQIAGKEAAENTLLWTVYDFKSPEVPAKVKAFADRYFAEHKEEPTSVSMRSYDRVRIYAEAIKSAGTLDPDKVVAQIEKMGKKGFDTLYGTAKLTGADLYGIDHLISLPVPLCVIEKNGVITFKGSIKPGM